MNSKDRIIVDAYDGHGVQMLYPLTGSVPLTGLYLGSNLRALAFHKRAYVYTNFLLSLDGRIALEESGNGACIVPQQTANQRDWRLLLELAAPADALIMSGRYLSQLGQGTAQSLPPFSGEVDPDLIEFRQNHGLPPKPVIVFVTRSLDIAESALDRLEDRQIIIATTKSADSRNAIELERRGVEVILLGDESVDGSRLIAALLKRGHQLIYSIAGPEVLHTLLSAGVLQRLYLTTVLRILAGEGYATLTRGPLLEPLADFRLSALYLDQHGPDDVEQLLQVYDQVNRE